MKIIAFTAKKQTGKTTAVEYMKLKYPDAVSINFKDALVEEIKMFFPEVLQAEIENQNRLAYDGMDPWTIEKLFRVKPPVIRALMRNYGTEVRRAQDPDYWVNAWARRVEKCDAEVVFVDDVRFLNEWGSVKNHNGLMIKIISDKVGPEDTHKSESEMDQIIPDIAIVNEFGNVEKLYKQLDEIK